MPWHLRRWSLTEGWRSFLVDVAVVVIGVLLALTAQQTADDWSWQGRIQEFRTTVDDEIGYDLYAYQNRLKQSTCVRQRLAELEDWLAAWRGGHPYPLAAPIGYPAATAMQTSTWDSRTDALIGRLPLHIRVGYARLYAGIDNVRDLVRREREPWAALQEYDGATKLDERDLMRLRGLINQARRLDTFLALNYTALLARSRDLGIAPRVDPTVNAPPPWHCPPMKKAV